MEESNANPRYKIERLQDIAPCRCPCGNTKRAFIDDPDKIASLHLVEIREDARTHYHKRLTEIYYFLEGSGFMELDGVRHPVGPGTGILIKPGCRHRAIGKLKILNIPIPAFDPNDEHFD